MINILINAKMFKIFVIEVTVHFDPTHLFQVVAANVKRQRLARHWSQQELGDRSVVGRTMIIRIESGEYNASLATLGRIALAFGVPFTEIVAQRARSLVHEAFPPFPIMLSFRKP